MPVLPVTPFSSPLAAALGNVIIETRFLEHRWPHEADRASMRRALFELHKEVSSALVRLDRMRPVEIDEATANRARDAFLATLVLAVLVQRISMRGHRGAPEGKQQLTTGAATAVSRLLDALDPFIARTDAALRRVMLAGVSSERAASEIALPA